MGIIIIWTDDKPKEAINAEPESLWNAQQTAEYLNCDEDAVYELARTGQLPCIKMGARRVRFNPPVIRQWVRNGGMIEPGLRLLAANE